MAPRFSDEIHPLLKARLQEPKTVFVPGHRIRMNIIPMFLNVFLPWGVFVLCCGLTSFWLLYKESKLVSGVLMLIFTLSFVGVGVAAVARREDPEPTWFSYVALTVLLAAVLGTACGLSNYTSFSRPYYAIQDLKVVHQMDAGRELGQNLMDAGIIYFAANNKLDFMKSWHFKQGTVYCVAPVTTNGTVPLTESYDFWAVGQDCCSTSTSDFRCGPDWSSVKTRSGIRVLDAEALTNYRLAVQQAEALYGIVSAHPIFFTWSQNPLAEVNSWRLQAFTNYVFFVVAAFCVFLVGVMVATCKYACLGRAASAYATDFYSDPDYKTAHMGQPALQAHGTRAYSPA
mmetsp:Transcript_82736/g.210483  ORF Transcript_82736/g.210483 Transcript_82736/m.210483 type:complete len:343 (-) Transcript_82736:72-1100(-)